MKKNILITGGLGFIGSNFIRKIILSKKFNKIINFDKQTYSSNKSNLLGITKDSYKFIKGDINNSKLLNKLFNTYNINIVVNFAAESHVDRSILNPDSFIKTNINGTFQLLNEFRKYRDKNHRLNNFKFIHISTDEVYGSLKKSSQTFTENSPYLPNNPYAASKAASDMIVRSFFKTYGLEACITNCSNNYGPYQYPEKIIPLTIQKCLSKKKIPIYGNGKQIRDWIHVEDHCDAIIEIINNGVVGETYNIGANNELTNLALVTKICKIFNNISISNFDHRKLIVFISDRPGHDKRYAINSDKIKKLIGWKPKIDFNKGLFDTINWYINNPKWLNNIVDQSYINWIDTNYNKRKVCLKN